MGLLTYLFGRRDPIADWSAVESFIDANAAFLVNRTMFEYSRARAGASADKMMREPDFVAAIEAARWTAFPIGVGDIAELVDSELRPHAGERKALLLDALLAATRGVLSRYPLPEGFAENFWDEARAAVEGRLRLAALAEPKRAIDIPLGSFPELFELIPIHPSLRAIDYNLVLNQVRTGMTSFLQDFRRRADTGALVRALPAAVPSAAGPSA